MGAGLILEAVVAVLLVVMIGYCLVLNRKLTAFRNTREEMASQIASLNEAITRAQQGISQLRSAAGAAEKNLRDEIIKARALSDELSFITEAGANLADRIEQGLVGGGTSAGADDVSEKTSTVKKGLGRKLSLDEITSTAAEDVRTDGVDVGEDAINKGGAMEAQEGDDNEVLKALRGAR
ncbi:MAG: hypothetical protein CMF31_10820 [Kordiimonas sp.]|nr:hypothetical protein [Kordiimonas sp.]